MWEEQQCRGEGTGGLCGAWEGLASFSEADLATWEGSEPRRGCSDLASRSLGTAAM